MCCSLSVCDVPSSKCVCEVDSLRYSKVFNFNFGEEEGYKIPPEVQKPCSVLIDQKVY